MRDLELMIKDYRLTTAEILYHMPDHPSLLTPAGFARIPLEALVGVALALALPAAARRTLAWVAGAALGLLLLVRLLDLGLLTIFDRRFDPVSDWRYTGIVIDTVGGSIGRTKATNCGVEYQRYASIAPPDACPLKSFSERSRNVAT